VTTAVDYALVRLPREEGDEAFAYNDANGRRVSCRTMTPPGNLTIADGINLETGLDKTERQWLLTYRLGKVLTALQAFWWFKDLDAPRASVLLDLGFNDGVQSLLHFPKMLAAIGAKNWPVAAAELLDSDAARQLESRYQPLSKILLTGNP
jgi:lysozyme